MNDLIKIIILLLFCGLLIILMKKSKYDFKGFELIPFWLSFAFFVYSDIGYDGMYYFPLGFLALYYLIRLIKTVDYIRWYIVLIQMFCSIGFIKTFSMYEDKVCQGWCVGTLLILLILIITFIYMMLINFITFIIKKLRFTQKQDINKNI